MGKFKLVDKKRIPELETETLKFWQKNKIFEKSVEQRPSDDLYVFYDGPPFISGLPHYGHLLSSIAKDVVPRYWTMKGKRVERVWGWDAHGLTVENKVQKRLGIKNRRDIESYGLEKFTQECYKYTSEISEEWKWYVDKIGRWVDFDNSYKTTDRSYMESVIWVFKQLYDKELIYEGVRTSLFCTTCGTPVSNFEIAMDNTYKLVEDLSVTVKFKITSKDRYSNAYFLVWTTTPWTLPSNRALVVDEDEDYVLVEASKEQYIIAEKRLDHVFDEMEHKIKGKFKGKDLLGIKYEPLFDFFESKAGEFEVYKYEDMVNMEEGTGIVHSAPGFGEIDTEMGRHNDLTIMLTIDDEGKFVQGNFSENPFEGMFYSEANEGILNNLKDRELIFKSETISHRFPYHDRCETLLIQKAQNSWFVKIDELRKDLIKNNESITWIPNHLKEGRFKTGIEQAPDWCISRTRFWATPMPVWESEDGDRVVVSSIKDLEELSGKKVKDLHRPYIDEIDFAKDGKTYKRRPEVLDSWFEAGSMPYGQLHYPFENKDKFEKNFPGDYIVEYIPQTRAWFYVMHVLSTALFNKSSFINAIGHGTLSGSDGRKMSKTYGNYSDPKEVLNNIGGDALRLYLMNSPLMVGDRMNFDEKELKTKLNNVLNPLWNSLNFFLIFANKHDWDFSNVVNSDNILDRWILVRLNQTIEAFTNNIEKYRVPEAVQPIEEFVDDLSRWYIRRSRARISAGDNDALSTLYTVLVTFSKVSAPIIPFISESLYQHLVSNIKSNEPESVHLCDYPTHDKKIIEKNSKLVGLMKNTRDIVSLALSIRAEKMIKVRQPLSTLYVGITGEKGDFLEELVVDEVNVKKIVKDEPKKKIPSSENSNFKVYLDTELSEELKLEGTAREIIRKIQDLRKDQKMKVEDSVEVVVKDEELNIESLKKYEEEIKDKVNAKKIRVGSEYRVKKI